MGNTVFRIQLKQLFPLNEKLQFSIGTMFLLDGKQFIDGVQIKLNDMKNLMDFGSNLDLRLVI